MEETVLRPRPMPGRAGESVAGARPEPVRRRGRRLLSALLGVLVALMLVLAGVGLGTVGSTVIGMSSLAGLKQQGLQLASPLGESGKSGQGASSDSGRTPSQEPQGGQEGAAAGGTASANKEAHANAAGREAPARATLGVEAVDLSTGGGAQVVGVHVPGPAYAAGLVRGDVILAVGGVRTASAAALAASVGKARPGAALTLTVRHRTGESQSLVVTPGVVT
ncbi:PDZ domain-containing protein [Streptomyces cavernicola]|uniref:PDZ domain-containing protein n=1 Tax=Streptomyces cavernicola TaxID=3043613 RepID=A0ABT6S2G3_9ACTN|nr:PDZ domain-containing protein [Streptomyces sp. B-S-A6]MDI3402289.1 PDZ domain-containing protein [Streptomyces sp. B-S-A6]